MWVINILTFFPGFCDLSQGGWRKCALGMEWIKGREAFLKGGF
jgi:hypothetical protein